MIAKLERDWYRAAFTLDSMLESAWTLDTSQEIDFVLDVLELSRKERILDLACGFGRHSLELASRGFHVVGVDVSEELITYAKSQAARMALEVDFVCSDLRDLGFRNEFDVVLNLCEGAIGYFETDEENLRTFRVIARALKRGGQHIMHIPNMEYARRHYPEQQWRCGPRGVELLELEWDEQTRSLYETMYQIRFGEVFHSLHPVREYRRVYDLEEIDAILKSVDMNVKRAYGDMNALLPASDEYEYMSVLSGKL